MSNKTKQFTIRTTNGLEHVNGYDIDKYAFVDRRKEKYSSQVCWVITDKRTGKYICKGDTRKETLELYKSDTMQERIKQAYKNALYKKFVKEFKALLKGAN